MKLSDREWKAFKVKNIFDSIVPTKGRTTNELVKGEDIPYIAASKTNNGYAGMYTLESCRNMISKGNAIVFIQLGDGAAGMAYYEPMDFIGMKGKTSCGYSSNLNQYVGIFLARCLSINKEKFSHGHSWTGSRLKNTQVMLPVTDDGEPDYQFMEDYVRELMIAKRKQYRDFVEKRLAELGVDVKNIGGGYRESLASRECKEFFLEDLFIVKAGKRLTNADKVDGDRPFIGATDNTNGVTGFVDNENNSIDRNVLGVNYNGAPCIGFYHPYECIFTDDVKRLHLKNYEDNAYVLLFMKSVIMQQRTKYSYGYKFNERRMLRQLLSVPVTETGEPDYEFMEEFGRKMMMNKYSQYLAFLALSDT